MNPLLSASVVAALAITTVGCAAQQATILQPTEESKLYATAIHRVEAVATPLNPLYIGSEPNKARRSIVLLVSGIDFKESDFYLPFCLAYQHSLDSYFFKWKKTSTFSYNVYRMKNALAELSGRYPSQKVLVFAHSAGGVIAMKAFKELAAAAALPPNIYLHTMAAPVNGYGAPDFFVTYLGAPLMGATTMTIGIGMKRLLSGDQINQCEQWVTTDCNKDIHACRKSSGFPQLMDRAPCGLEHTHFVSQETHASIIFYTMEQVLGPNGTKLSP